MDRSLCATSIYRFAQMLSLSLKEKRRETDEGIASRGETDFLLRLWLAALFPGHLARGFFGLKAGRAECIVGEIGEEMSDDKKTPPERTYAFSDFYSANLLLLPVAHIQTLRFSLARFQIWSNLSHKFVFLCGILNLTYKYLIWFFNYYFSYYLVQFYLAILLY